MELDNHHGEISRQLKEVKWKKEKILEELKREQTLLDMTRLNFNKKKGDYLKYLAQSSSNATQVIYLEIGCLILGDLFICCFELTQLILIVLERFKLFLLRLCFDKNFQSASSFLS